MNRPTQFEPPTEVSEKELFEESSLGVLSARQSTNYRGYKQLSYGPKDSATLATLLRALDNTEAPVLDNASMTHVVLDRPYRTPFTMLLTFVGHKALAVSLITVPVRAFRKRCTTEMIFRPLGIYRISTSGFWLTHKSVQRSLHPMVLDVRKYL